MRAKRSKNEILQEILNTCSNGENITQIGHRSNLNLTTARCLIDSLKKDNLLETIDGSPVLYKTTAEGMAFSKRLKVLQDELEEMIGKHT